MADLAAWTSALGRARAYAPFLARSLDRLPELAELLAHGQGEAALDWARERGRCEDTGVALRRERLALATALAIGDLAGAFSLTRVMGELTAFADRALDRAIRTAIQERTGEDSARGFIALALGKQGAGELNYSSDIDPVLLFDPAALPRRATDDPGEAAQRYTRRIIALLSENTAEGYAFRVDLRLRPASEISLLAVPRELALVHYQSAALPWERAAFTRARAAAGDIQAGEAFLEAIRPFVWRSALDFGAMEEIRSLTARIRDTSSGPLTPGRGYNVKRGRGGIREIEFIVQTFQLIHGGRDPALRVRGTHAALDALAKAGRIVPDHAETLARHYDRLRVVEHRLQMINDSQTHSLPKGPLLDNVARLDGLADGSALVDELRALTDETAQIYSKLIGEPKRAPAAPASEPMPQEEREERLGTLGFDNAKGLAERIAAWRDGRYQTLRSEQALAAFDALTPALLEAFAQSDDPMRALTRWENLLERASTAVTLFRLLNAQPHLLDRLVGALTLAPTLSDELARKPELLDILLDSGALELPGSVEDIAAHIQRSAERSDYEALLDAIRRITGELRFALGIQLIEGLADPLAIGAALSRIAGAALSLAVPAAHAEFAARHGRIEGSELLVLGLGRFGGGALTHASDLDLVYLFNGDLSLRSDGERSLSTTNYYNRLASRVTAALSVPTAQGALYEVDTRLRPQGAQGPLAVSCAAFEKYQRDAAWTWEHMALARARVLIGSPKGHSVLETIMRKVLRRARDPHSVRAEVSDMRAQMARHKSPAGPLDVKRQRGGLIDCEFLVHYFQLRGVARDATALADRFPDAYSPDLGAAIPALTAAGLLPESFRSDYDLLTRMLVALRLLAPDGLEPPACAARALARACRAESYEALLADFAAARARVCAVWNQTFDADISDTVPQTT
ncbi:MAG: bifunctional [glutamate--ammonia ligase]-adenylyl-L-tyrosine phosphorylase/[glutamate--ammonia-ligase] adenylyltransferase [Erythrobacter sp.]|uniref:bifunctional [glutamate--ammonia ligase]-adenylyl-L-tyrosine phosphorylase/[glutamate--ammonia-ligase] adenylyltransferase n=1 Tax=Erythrobacter sp. TaxID=1042 RepID=UPI002605C3BD|nr:bifunctional [glutamate--ammonia ligase]-adenylyl-L-tyrosine phosphorylase/[glutamate--ammonia-ligase] adenylyltransferase [Erythrobacter sp.]MDJ0978335.1 bifunctional [glutamate--ammonia ligase]-adenylyl-L-tyrosine phosphorylase/[glutamate--ammonia-ligase] adenylyltransferase [Erythrobacter sp.]